MSDNENASRLAVREEVIRIGHWQALEGWENIARGELISDEREID